SIVSGALLLAPILVPFFQDYGLNLTQILWLQACFGLAVAALEVPSGYFSDTIGRKPALVVGAFGITLGFSVFSIASGFWTLLLGELVLAVGWSFISGTNSALLYDTLVELGEEENYAKVFGRHRSSANFSEAGASILGAAIAVASIRLPALVQIGLYSLSIPIALSLVEPARQRFTNSAGPLAGIREIALEAVALKREVRLLIVLSGIVGTATLAMAWLSQPWLNFAGVPLVSFGLIWAALRITVGISALCASRIQKRLGFNGSVTLILAILTTGFALCAWKQAWWLVPAIATFTVVRGLAMVIFSEAINQHTGSDRRATVLSLESLLCRLIFAPLAPLIGWIADAYSLGTAIGLSGLFFALTTTLTFRRLIAPRRRNILTELPIRP
ncbi:MAG: putative MFS family arabinose efflux permease, partial [Pseudoalteromonas tetraodonis]